MEGRVKWGAKKSEKSESAGGSTVNGSSNGMSTWKGGQSSRLSNLSMPSWMSSSGSWVSSKVSSFTGSSAGSVFRR
jgi:chitin synthase